MTTTDWIVVAIAMLGGILIGTIASRIVNSIIGSESRPDPVRNAAGPLSSLVLWAGIVGGLIVALGVVSPNALEQLPKDVINFIPRVISAAIVVIVANVGAAFAQTALAPALGRMPSSVQRQILSAVRISILTLATLLAVRQLGFDTTVINIGVAAVLFGASGAVMLLIGLGGRDVAEEVASTRVLRRLLNPGDQVHLEDVRGQVMTVHPTTVEIASDTGEILLVPSSRFVTGTFSIVRSDPDQASTEK